MPVTTKDIERWLFELVREDALNAIFNETKKLSFTSEQYSHAYSKICLSKTRMDKDYSIPTLDNDAAFSHLRDCKDVIHCGGNKWMHLNKRLY